MKIKRIATAAAVTAAIVIPGAAFATVGGVGYIDSNGDGVCDNYASSGCHRGSDYGACGGAGYIDNDGDGICDNYDSAAGGHRGIRTCNGAGAGSGSGAGSEGGYHGHHGQSYGR